MAWVATTPSASSSATNWPWDDTILLVCAETTSGASVGARIADLAGL